MVGFKTVGNKSGTNYKPYSNTSKKPNPFQTQPLSTYSPSKKHPKCVMVEVYLTLLFLLRVQLSDFTIFAASS